MINLNHYQENCFEFYTKALSRKRDQAYKDRMDDFRAEISDLFDEYSEAFNENNLKKIESCNFTDLQKSDLISLYDYRSAIIQKLKIILTTDANNRIINTCQNCTINSINSFDHFLPKSEFPQYAVNPLNLFPSCTQCNSKKSTSWLDDNGKPRFLNLYLDSLPQEQYLFVDFDFSNSGVKSVFRLEKGSINDEIYNRISRHYNDLDLLDRFRIESHRIITELINSLEGNRNTLSNNQLIEFVRNTERRNKISFGSNYWESILRESIINFDEFWNLF